MIINFEETKKQIKKENLKRKVEGAVNKVKDTAGQMISWSAEHPMEAIAIASAVLATTNKCVKYKQTKAEDYRRATDLYDNRRGTHAIARRPLTARESLEVERRYENGESYKQILWDMKLLK